MARLSSADHSVSPPIINIPHDYNAAHDLIERNLSAGRGAKVAYHDAGGSHTYGDLAERVNRCASVLTDIGLEMEQRVLLCVHDTIDFPTAFLGAIKLQVRGPSAAIMYWNNRERSRTTFQGPWTCTGDKYMQREDGRYVHAGRNDDMLKVSGLHVSPVEVESALIAHPAVLEAAVVGKEDEARLIKPIAFVVLQPDQTPSPELADELKQHVKARLAMYKYPRWIDFVTELPKTVTGKIQRYKLRERAAQTTSGRAA